MRARRQVVDLLVIGALVAISGCEPQRGQGADEQDGGSDAASATDAHTVDPRPPDAAPPADLAPPPDLMPPPDLRGVCAATTTSCGPAGACFDCTGAPVGQACVTGAC